MTASHAPHEPARESRGFDAAFWLTVVAVMLVTFVLRTSYVTMDDVTNGRYDTLSLRLLEEITGTITAFPSVVLAAWAARRAPFPPSRLGWGRTLLVHAATFAVGTSLHTVLMASTRTVLAPMLGFTGYDYGRLGLRLLMEAPNDLLYYAAVVAARLVTDSRRRARAREREAMALERALAQSRLENLQLQLQPHFLFNALNTISSVMYEDPEAADRMLGHLADLLRHAIGRAGVAEIPLAEELVLLESYLALARARFGDDLEVLVHAPAPSRDATVPPLLLQPLVENAIRHGVTPAGAGRVEIRVSEEGERLVLVVENGVPAAVGAAKGARDEGAGVAGEPRGHGMGLAVTRRRLALLYGDDASLEAGPLDAGTFRVVVTIPRRAAGGG